MKIEVRSLQNHVRINKNDIIKSAESALKKMGERRCELSLLFVDDAYIRRLNRKYRKIDAKTDVLAFPMREGAGLSKNSPILGDVAISVEMAESEALKRNVPTEKELKLYLAHGILHLLGYKDTRASDRKKMQRKQKELLRAM